MMVNPGFKQPPRKQGADFGSAMIVRDGAWPDWLCAVGVAFWMFKPVGDIRLVLVGYLLFLLGAVVNGYRKGLWLDPLLLVVWLAVLLVGFLGSIIGLQNRNPGVKDELVFFVVLPFVWLVLASGTSLATIQNIINIIPFVAMAVGVLGLLYWFDASGLMTIPGITKLPLGQGIGRHEFGYGLRFYPISTLVFAVPFLALSLIVRDTYTHRLSRGVAVVALISTLGLQVVAGRRVLFLSLAVAVGFCVLVFFRDSSQKLMGLRSVGVMAAAGATTVVAIRLSGFSVRRYLDSMWAAMTQSGNVRVRSTRDLLDSWSRAPVLGNGLGATIGTARSVERPWAFEVQYHLVLNAMGVVGFLVLTVAAVGTFAALCVAIRRDRATLGFVIPLVGGGVAALAANATNPYLHTPGHYYMLFLVILSANAVMRYRKGVHAVKPLKAGAMRTMATSRFV